MKTTYKNLLNTALGALVCAFLAVPASAQHRPSTSGGGGGGGGGSSSSSGSSSRPSSPPPSFSRPQRPLSAGTKHEVSNIEQFTLHDLTKLNNDH
ncbi:MAG: hypothetical protein V4577_05020 [Bacteroidota bacterium]